MTSSISKNLHYLKEQQNNNLDTNIKSLLKLCLPIMLAELSSSIMHFTNRVILANYSLEAMNSSLAATTPYNVFYFSVISIVSITEIFVGRYNGSRQFAKIGAYVWQMLWFSLFVSMVLAALALCFADKFIPVHYHQFSIPYFQVLMSSIGIAAANVALGAFYIGRGKIKMVIFSVVLANVSNIALDIILVFGVTGMISPLGVQGAAISLVIANSLQFSILFTGFLKTSNRKNYHTYDYSFKFSLLKKGLIVAIPGCLASILEMAAWAVFVYIAASVNRKYMLVYSIGDSVFALFSFIIDGLYKGISTTAANVIGSERYQELNKLLFSSIKLIACLAALLFIVLIFKHEFFSDLFIKEPEALVFKPLIKNMLFWIWLYFTFGSLLWVLNGMLIAANDIVFISVVNIGAVCICAILPSTICVFWHIGEVYSVWQFYVLYSVITAAIFYLRYIKVSARLAQKNKLATKF